MSKNERFKLLTIGQMFIKLKVFSSYKDSKILLLIFCKVLEIKGLKTANFC